MSIESARIEMSDLFFATTTLAGDIRKLDTVIVHDGIFHADDVCAVALLEMAAGIKLKVIRTRKELETSPSCWKMDVGGRCDPAANIYDHHMKDNPYKWTLHEEDVEEPTKVNLASAGMAFHAYGEQAITGVLNDAGLATNYGIVKSAREALMPFILCVDAIDNGQSYILAKGDQMSFSEIISMLNCSDAFSELQDECFDKAVDLAHTLMVNIIVKAAEAFLYQMKIIQALMAAGDGVLVLKEAGPWREFLKSHWDMFEKIKLLIYPSGQEWRVQTLPSDPEDMQSMRCPAPKDWRGLRDEELCSKTGMNHVTFIHPAGFIGGATSEGAALNLALGWIKQSQTLGAYVNSSKIIVS